MKEIPILFSTEMVQALMDGRKTQTRRMVSPQPDENGASYMPVAPCLEWEQIYKQEWKPWNWTTDEGQDIMKHSPYGKPGDMLWVRESWRVKSWWPEDGELSVSYATGDGADMTLYDLEEDIFNRLWEQSCNDLEKAGYHVDEDENYTGYKDTDLRLRPSIHMPKEAARIWLRVTDVRIERLNDISEDDARSEGILSHKDEFNRIRYKDYLADGSGYGDPQTDYPTVGMPICSFYTLWESNGRDSWNANPWVWVVSFEVVSTTGKNNITP